MFLSTNGVLSCVLYSLYKSIELITDGLGAYESALILFKNINHVVVSLGKNMCESKFSLLKDFFRLKRGLKKSANLDLYIHGFCVVKNLWKINKSNIDNVISQLATSSLQVNIIMFGFAITSQHLLSRSNYICCEHYLL